jgi:hypothetical protein
LNGNNVFDAFDPADPTKGPEPFAVTGANGFFAFANLAPGTYTLRDDRLPLSSGTFRVQSFPNIVATATQDSDEHRVTITAGETISGSSGAAASPNFGGSEYSPLVRPADDHLGHALRLASGNDLLAALASWQSIELRNTTGALFQITSIDESSIAEPGPSLVQVLRCDGSPLALPLSVPVGAAVLRSRNNIRTGMEVAARTRHTRSDRMTA